MSGLVLDVDGDARSKLVVQVAAGGRLLIRQDGQLVLLAKVHEDRSGVEYLTTNDFQSVVAPMRAVHAEAIANAGRGGWNDRWAHSELLMTADLRGHRQNMPAAPYRLLTQVDSHGGDSVVTATVRHESGEVGARGTMGLAGTDAVADRIETVPAHRRKGLASAIMSALARSAIEEGVERGILIASEDGQRLYMTLGWQPVADVLIATTPGNTYPS